GAIVNGWTLMRLSRYVALHSRHFNLESFLSFLLRYRTDAQTDTNLEISLIDESSSVLEDGDAWCACRDHGLLRWGGEAFSEAAENAGKLSTNGFIMSRSHAINSSS